MISSPPRSAHRSAHRRAEPTPYVDLTRAEWSALREKTPLPLTADEVERLRGLGDVIDLDEVRDVYLPLSRLLNLYVGATDNLRGALNTFLGDTGGGNGTQYGTPFVIGVAGSVAVGKSTVARLLQALLARWPEHPRVELVTTDGFLWPMKELKERGLTARKGFPESYDRRALTRFVADIKAGKEEVTAPVYSHLIYDIVPGRRLTVRRPDILIVEGLNVLQPALPGKDGRTRVGLADYFDFSVYVDAKAEDIEQWYLNRFKKLRQTAFQNPDSYFHRHTTVTEEEALDYARTMWHTINKPNLLQNVAPTRGRADLVLRKGPDHKVQRLRLRKL
ncbi:type I pantothenate kinase [Streptomyces cavernicola]|uniref:Pantothenate kinase n=1 Tax=Streptomyces cavernicola TaxID=3043613 RepID=A0ABT6SE30_9ACTN|nr:type I pantothenate kinase [Streptomyces sp. B-S-A6]MDI3405551.1 type I pantothenate kinase [Streptomyces sp. B-S-A6]